MKRWILAALVVSLLLSGCTFGTQVYTNETDPTFPEMVRREEKAHSNQEINKEYADGRTERVEYEFEYDGTIFPYLLGGAFYENDQLIRQERYEVDENRNVIRVVTDGDEINAVSYELTYDEALNIVEKKTVQSGEEVLRETFAYNEQGQLIEQCEYEAEKLLRRTVTEYGENGWRSKVLVYGPDGKLLSRRDFSHDEKKYSETVLEYDGADNLVRRLENGYNIDRVLVAQEVFDAQDAFLERTYWRYATSVYSYLVPVDEIQE